MEKKYKPINRRRMERVSPHISDVTDLCEVINHHGERIVFRYFEGKEVKSLTYAAFGEMVHAMAAAFNAMGLTGEKVVVIGDASPQWHCTYLAALAAGCVIVPMDKELDIEDFVESVKSRDENILRIYHQVLGV